VSGPAAPGRARALAAAGWGRASREGALAFSLMLAIALGVASAAVALGVLGLRAADVPRVGGAYLALVHRIPLRVTAEGSDLWLVRVLGAPVGTTAFEARLAVAPLALTALAAWLLWRAGRRTAEAVGGSSGARALHGAKVAPAHALLVLLATLPARVELAPAALDLRMELSVPPGPALLLPLLLAAAAGAAGGWWSAASGGTARAALLGGWTMLLAGLGLALAGLFVAGVVRPEGPEAFLTPTTGRYLQAAFARPSVGAAALVHHVAVLPNEAAWTLVPAMGGCTGAYPGDGEPVTFLCYGRFPLALRLPVWLRPPGVEAGPPTRFGAAPWPYLAFLLVPAAATVLGGRRAAAQAGGRCALPAALGGGAVFAVLVLVLGWVSSVSASSTARTAIGPPQMRSVRIGPDLGGGAALALGWGVAGGALGGALSGWSGARRAGARRRG
jgi:hypothetical protein